MFETTKQKRQKQEQERLQYEEAKRNAAKTSYDTIVDLAKRYASEEKTPEERQLWLDYLINSILDDICTATVVEPLIDPTMGILQPLFPTECYDENGQPCKTNTGKRVSVSLSESRIYVRPMNSSKTARNLVALAKEDFVFDADNHFSCYYPEIDLCYVGNGNHSINAGRYLGKGEIISREHSLARIFPHCYTDGAYWYNAHTREKFPGSSANDFRIAAVYTPAKIRANIVGSC